MNSGLDLVLVTDYLVWKVSGQSTMITTTMLLLCTLRIHCMNSYFTAILTRILCESIHFKSIFMNSLLLRVNVRFDAYSCALIFDFTHKTLYYELVPSFVGRRKYGWSHQCLIRFLETLVAMLSGLCVSSCSCSGFDQRSQFVLQFVLQLYSCCTGVQYLFLRH